MRQLIKEGLRPPALVFVQSVDRAKQLFRELIYDGINVDVMHADRTQAQRDRVIQQFRSGAIWVLICTDLMARGIDFKGVNLVVEIEGGPRRVIMLTGLDYPFGYVLVEPGFPETILTGVSRS